jgi:hypothetical protein
VFQSDMPDLDPSQYVEADRREVDPPIEVEPAALSPGANSIGGSRSAESGGAEYAAQTVVRGRPKLLIFVRPQKAESAAPCY